MGTIFESRVLKFADWIIRFRWLVVLATIGIVFTNASPGDLSFPFSQDNYIQVRLARYF